MGNPLFVLASKSPRRQELLKKIGIQAEIMRANVDESSIGNLPPEKTVTELALLKAFRWTVKFLENRRILKMLKICSENLAEKSTAFIQDTV